MGIEKMIEGVVQKMRVPERIEEDVRRMVEEASRPIVERLDRIIDLLADGAPGAAGPLTGDRRGASVRTKPRRPVKTRTK